MTAPGLQAFAILLLCLAPLAPANEGVAQLTPSARGLQATGETRAASHLRLAAANPWAKPGHDGPAVVVRTIGSRPTNEDVGVARLNVTQPAHDDLAKQNPWAKPLSTTLASHSRATVDSAARAEDFLPPLVRNTEPRSATAASESSETAEQILRPERNWVRLNHSEAQPSPYLQDLETLLARAQDAPVPSTPSDTTPDCRYTDVASVFTPLAQTTAYDPAEDQNGEPTDCASTMMGGEVASHFYYAQVSGGPPQPNRTARPFYHNPLYYQDINLERCGVGYGCATTAVSAARFFGSALISPYLMTLDHPTDCILADQDCPACTAYSLEDTLPEWSWKAAAAQAGAITAGFYIVP